jgi:Abnormal spindle-like microcephaly-assoc'd, ASPM-SPD-2-Hydin/HYDIN/CFA65/VesB-like, Ig-like domain/Cep192 domain 4
MARANLAATSRGRKFGAGKVSGWGVAALFAVMACGGTGLSGCAGFATPSNATPTPQEAVQISPSSISFAAVAPGQKATQTATLTNSGTESVTITQLALSSTEFSTSGLATPLSIGPGQSAKFQVTYTGTTSGDSSATLTAMTSRGGGSSKVKLRGASGKGGSTLSLSTTALNFGNVLVNGSGTQAVTLKNSGQTDIQVSQIGVTGGAFTTTGLAAPATIAAGQSVALQAKFAPTAAGAVTGAITITSDAQTATSTIALNGTGVAATYTMSLSPTSVNFGNVSTGSSATQNVQLSNTGNSSVTVSQIAASGTGISVSGATAPLTIAPAQSVTLAVKFAPTTSGAATGSLAVTNNEGVNALAAVTGTGVQAGLSVTPSSASFGSVVSGNTNSQTIQVKNSGTASLTISQATVTGTGFSLSGLAIPLTLAPGQSGNFNVQYAPKAAGSVSGSVSISSNAPNSPATVALSGTGVAASYTISVNPSSLSFGSVNNGNSTAQGFTVTNTGNSNVAISGVTATGAGYSIVSGAGAVTLSPNQSTSVSVQFAPSVAGTAGGSATILSNATGSNSSVALSGTGVAPSVQHSVALNWGPSTTSVAGYYVYRSVVKGSSYARMTSSPVGGMSYADSSVQSGQTYYYVATSVDVSGTESVFSNEVSAVIP